MGMTEQQFDAWWKDNGIESATFAEKSAARKGWNAAIAAQPASAQRDTKRLNADALREPIDGNEWRVQWWNESCRMMLPAGMVLDGFQSYRNGTLQFTIKKRPATTPAQGEA